MFIRFLSMLAMIPGTYAIFRGLCLVVPIEKPRRYCMTASAAVMGTWIFNHMVLAEPSVIIDLTMCMIVCCSACPVIPRERYVQGILSGAILQMLQLMIAVATTYVATAVLGLDEARVTGPTDYVHPVLCLLVSVASIFCMHGAGKLMGRYLPKYGMDLSYIWFAAIPVSQLLLLDMAARPAFDLTGYTNFRISMLICIPFCLVADAACVLAYGKLRNLEKLKVDVVQAEKMIADQTRYYNNLQAQILSVNQIRHDLNNQLTAARYLLEQGDREQVSVQLDQLEASIARRVGPRFCENLVVDAVMAAKEEECRRENISLDVSLVLPRDMNIENAHLCSLFSNLLDNSIEGIRQTKTGNGWIRLRSDVRSGYLTVTCSNPAVLKEKKKSRDVLRSHGLGMEILESLSRKYSGHMESNYIEGIYTTAISLKNPRA